jgi:serine/threonine protein kinase
MNELAGQSLGGYELEEEIGRGSMGIVYRGKQIALGREVAIKVLSRGLASDASYAARFIREAQIIAGLNHPNIVQIYDAGQQQGLLYFVMEYVQGPTLASLLHLDGTIPLYLAAEYAAQIADALHAAYIERNVIHRDIKPENLMLDRWGKLKVMDFGLARAIGHQKITVAKTLVGSLYYASPEQVWGQTLDNRSDIYALGVVLYEMVTGHRPFTGRTLPELTQAIISSPLSQPHLFNTELSPEFERIIVTAMARDRHERYEQAAVMAQHLRALNLKPPAQPQLSQDGKSKNAQATQPKSPEQVVIQPPKRPQIRISPYMTTESAKPLPQPQSQPQKAKTALENSPLSPRAQAEIQQMPTKPLPVSASPTSTASTASAASTIDTEGPTGPLEQIAPSAQPQHPTGRRNRKAQHEEKQQKSIWDKVPWKKA